MYKSWRVSHFFFNDWLIDEQSLIPQFFGARLADWHHARPAQHTQGRGFYCGYNWRIDAAPHRRSAGIGAGRPLRLTGS
jgi:hypothetical protein